MKNFSRIFVMTLCALAMLIPAARAALTEKDVTQFVSAIQDVENFSDTLKKEGKDKALEADASKVDQKKGFAPYANGVESLKTKFPDDYKKLGDIVKSHGFANQENWADTSDSVMHAYMALKIQEQNPDAFKQLKAMTPEEKAKMPPEAQQQIERAMAMMKIVESAPEADKTAVKKHMTDIDAWLDRAAKADAAAKELAAGEAPQAEAKPEEKKTP
jgi:hypothetical protein